MSTTTEIRPTEIRLVQIATGRLADECGTDGYDHALYGLDQDERRVAAHRR